MAALPRRSVRRAAVVAGTVAGLVWHAAVIRAATLPRRFPTTSLPATTVRHIATTAAVSCWTTNGNLPTCPGWREGAVRIGAYRVFLYAADERSQVETAVSCFADEGAHRFSGHYSPFAAKGDRVISSTSAPGTGATFEFTWRCGSSSNNFGST
jgi:hypothetical protein